jgi:hypothetical protein
MDHLALDSALLGTFMARSTRDAQGFNAGWINPAGGLATGMTN